MIIGITGGIGCGKSTVTNHLLDLGYNVIDCDKLAREIVEPGMPALKKLTLALGPEILNEDGTLDRGRTGDIVFNDDEKRRVLDEITHSAILELMNERLKESNDEHNFIDAALIFETGLDKEMDMVWLVTCDNEIRKKRVMARDNLSEEMVEAKIASQMSDKKKALLASEIIDNSGTMEETYANVDRLLEKYL